MVLSRLESKSHPLLGRLAFLQRLGGYTLAAGVLIFVSLLAGMWGYHALEGMAWIDAFANAAMILSGMGPLSAPQHWGGKLFAGLYALYSGLILIISTGIILTPIVHRVMHRFHLERKDGSRV